MSAPDRKLSRDEKPIKFLFEYSVFLIVGALAGLIWVNSGPIGAQTHENLFSFELSQLFFRDGEVDHENSHNHGSDNGDPNHAVNSDSGGHVSLASHPEGEDDGHAEHHDEHHGHPVDVRFLINGVLMALFFGIAAKEVWESMLPGGALSNPKKAAMPLLATLGGIVGPAGLYLVVVIAVGQMAELGRGWAVPCATDIAFSYLVARLIFGPGHPAIAFLLLLAIADDAAGLIIIAVAYSENVQWSYLLLTVVAMVLAWVLRRFQVQSFWWYLLIPGAMSWCGFFLAGVEPALGLVPVIPFMPHAATDLGIFAKQELNRHDTLNEFEHWWKNPVEVILGLFGLCNAGVLLSSVGMGTWAVLVGLIIGKPLGITLFTWLGEKVFRLEKPVGLGYKHVVSLGCIAGIGFTVALFVSTAAFNPSDPSLDVVKMGALMSFGSAFVAIVVAKMLGVKRLKPDEKIGK